MKKLIVAVTLIVSTLAWAKGGTGAKKKQVDPGCPLVLVQKPDGCYQVQCNGYSLNTDLSVAGQDNQCLQGDADKHASLRRKLNEVISGEPVAPHVSELPQLFKKVKLFARTVGEEITGIGIDDPVLSPTKEAGIGFNLVCDEDSKICVIGEGSLLAQPDQDFFTNTNDSLGMIRVEIGF